MKEFTLERNLTVVRRVPNHFHKQVTWRTMSEFTVELNPLVVYVVLIHLEDPTTWRSIKDFTQFRSHMIPLNILSHSNKQMRVPSSRLVVQIAPSHAYSVSTRSRMRGIMKKRRLTKLVIWLNMLRMHSRVYIGEKQYSYRLLCLKTKKMINNFSCS